MKLDDIYSKILNICEEIYIDEPYVVGGMPRNLHMNTLDEHRDLSMPHRTRGDERRVEQQFDAGVAAEEIFKDVDITTNDSDITRLAIALSDELGKPFKVFKDGHVSVYVDNIILDFSSHFISDRVVDYLMKELNIEDEKLFEIYSRDFTLNTLHKRFFDNEILDPTNVGKEDLDKKIIRTTVPAEITLTDDFRRIYRAINFAARFNFNIDDDIVNFAKNNREKFTGEKKWVLKEAFITSIIAESVSSNADITMHYLSEMNLLPTVPLIGRFKEEIIKRKLVNKYLDDAINLNEYVLNDLSL